MDDMLDIREVVRRTGLTSRTLRFYETKGLLEPLRTHKGRRLYGPGALERINQIVALKRAGFTLARIESALATKPPDLARLVDAQLAALVMRQQEMGEAMVLLTAVSARLERGERIDVETFCALIRRGDSVSESDSGKREMARRLFDEGEQNRMAARMWAFLYAIDPEDIRRRYLDLISRVEAALPLDVESAEALALAAEWEELNEPLMAFGKPGPAPPLPPGEEENAKARLDEWSRVSHVDCPPRVWEFLFTATRHRARKEMTYW